MVPLLLGGFLYPEARTLFKESATSGTDPARHCAVPSFSLPGSRHQSAGLRSRLLQASGLAGLAFAYLSVLLGLQQSARVLPGVPLSYRQIDRLHRRIFLLVIGLVLVHVVTHIERSGGRFSCFAV
jgi:hypothetical protein